MRIYAIIAAVLALAGAALYWKHVTGELTQARAENVTLTATIAQERANRAIEQADRKHNDETVISLQDQLADLFKPHPAPVVYCRARLPSATPESIAATGASSAAVSGSNEGPLSDIGPALDAARLELETNAARQQALIRWEQERTH